MSSLSENDIKKAVYDKPDGRGKFLLTSKLIIAQLLKFLIPDQFGNMSLKEIVNFCFDGNPENPFIELLSEENNEAGGNKYINDLVFKIKLPKPIEISGIKFNQLLINIEPQSSDPTTYVLSIRGLIYSSKHFLNENEYLNLATTKDMYQNAIPVLTIWINTNSKDKTSGIRFGNFQWRYNYLYPDNKPIEINEENSMMMVTEINLGEDIDLNKKDIYSYLYMLLVNSDPEKVIDTLYDYEILEKGEDEMFITPVEKEWKKEGIKEGLKEGIEKGIEKGEAQGIKKGSMETQTKMFFQLVNAIQKENSGITKNEAIERAKKIFELDEIPEIP